MRGSGRNDCKETKEASWQRYEPRQAKGPRGSTFFKGESPNMHGNVFEVLGERGTRRQFKDTLEALERYTGETYPREIALLQPMFRRLEEPKLEAPKAPLKIEVKRA